MKRCPNPDCARFGERVGMHTCTVYPIHVDPLTSPISWVDPRWFYNPTPIYLAAVLAWHRQRKQY